MSDATFLYKPTLSHYLRLKILNKFILKTYNRIFLKMTYLCFGSLLESIDTGIENRGFFSTHSCFGNTVRE